MIEEKAAIAAICKTIGDTHQSPRADVCDQLKNGKPCPLCAEAARAVIALDAPSSEVSGAGERDAELVARLRKRKNFGTLVDGQWSMVESPDDDCQEAADRLESLSRPSAGGWDEATNIILIACAFVDVWMGGDKSWRTRLFESEFLESADWNMAVKLATAAIRALPRPAPDAGLREALDALKPFADAVSRAAPAPREALMKAYHVYERLSAPPAAKGSE